MIGVVSSLMILATWSTSAWGMVTQIAAWRDQPWFWATLAGLLLSGGLWAIQPGSRRGRRFMGYLACLAGLAFCIRLLPALSGTLPVTLTFRLMAVLSLASGLATVTSRNPVYCAIWFALTLVGTAFLMLLLGGQFVAVATVAVYAGAIVVTFLFVLMLAQSSGRAAYDRMTWGVTPAWWAAPAAMVVFVTLMLGLHREVAGVPQSPAGAPAVGSAQHGLRPAPGEVAERFAANHVAHLGRTLFSKYLIPVQVVATLLLAALVGAVAIASYGPTSEVQEMRR